MRKRIVTALVHNRSGVLNRVTGLFTKRQFNIESISVGYTEVEGISRMTFVVNVEDDRKIEQLLKQLHKQIDVLKVSDITDQGVVARELALIKVLSTGQTRSEINGIVEPFRAAIIDVARDSVTVQVTGETSKIEAIIDLLRPYGIKEIARTGITAFARGNGKSVTDLKQYSIVN
ncbi:acetolactate synthase small subunit [Rossellomorea aquimaris]|jgi:acetolactate synthase I/III small subunit|uniref:acetolactate synthase small subunit n=1 Tax=Bacillaceae TaxID=186817 RepID=UPI0005C80245|nr:MULTISPECIES: acetolactate synthase small subunit [Bacillaceae]MBN8192286.1 acetolactate synthase small subunit [Bacillus sp. NTK074B]MBW3112871.1 acetolactate synthase small subunit [Bacillus sp. MCCB 382]NMH70900.1 acetolactate synthase small subunit [Bacillus sp. RO3]WJV30175.1 acetolactate synthase small subunit [Rossellomorea sp. AcN35-11]KAA0566927.1 acetolactate synthase small subunit [Bacillus sp. CH30_1T]